MNDDDALLDPRGTQERTTLQLAPRVSMEELREGPVLFYDNTKLDFCNYRHVFLRLKENLAELGVTNIVEIEETVRGKSSAQLAAYGASLVARFRPKAAVVALGDMGTSPATTIVTIGIEQAGVPAVYITAPPGSELVRAVAHYRAGNLCLCPVDIFQGSTPEEVRAEVDRQTKYVVDALTLPPRELLSLATIDLDLDREAPTGILELPQPVAMEASQPSATAADRLEDVHELFASLRLTDGLPIVPPTRRRYDAMLTYCPWAPEFILAREVGPSGKDITVRDIAVAAVMAGCKPAAMPVLVTAFRGMSNERYNFLQSVTTSHPGGNLVLVSGPLSEEVGLYGGQGCMGPGPWANLAIGRAVNLVLINTARSVPGVCDLACTSSQAEITYCFAEQQRGRAPWPTINEERFDERTTTVYVLKAEPPHDIIDFLSTDAGDLLDTIVDSCTTLGSNNAYMPGALVLVLVPDHIELLRRGGWDKDALRTAIHERVHNETALVRNRGLSPARPREFENRHPMPVTRSPADVEIVVAGGRGGHSVVILPWALHSEGIVEPILLPTGAVPGGIEDFRAVG